MQPKDGVKLFKSLLVEHDLRPKRKSTNINATKEEGEASTAVSDPDEYNIDDETSQRPTRRKRQIMYDTSASDGDSDDGLGLRKRQPRRETRRSYRSEQETSGFDESDDGAGHRKPTLRRTTSRELLKSSRRIETESSDEDANDEKPPLRRTRSRGLRKSSRLEPVPTDEEDDDLGLRKRQPRRITKSREPDGITSGEDDIQLRRRNPRRNFKTESTSNSFENHIKTFVTDESELENSRATRSTRSANRKEYENVNTNGDVSDDGIRRRSTRARRPVFHAELPSDFSDHEKRTSSRPRRSAVLKRVSTYEEYNEDDFDDEESAMQQRKKARPSSLQSSSERRRLRNNHF